MVNIVRKFIFYFQCHANVFTPLPVKSDCSIISACGYIWKCHLIALLWQEILCQEKLEMAQVCSAILWLLPIITSMMEKGQAMCLTSSWRCASLLCGHTHFTHHRTCDILLWHIKEGLNAWIFFLAFWKASHRLRFVVRTVQCCQYDEDCGMNFLLLHCVLT